MSTQTKMTWRRRWACGTKEQAMEALADCVQTKYRCISEGGAESSFYLQGQVAEFAAVWGVPCDLNEMHTQASQVCLEKEGYEPEYGGWMASYC